MDRLPSLSTEQVATFVYLARLGSIRGAAEALYVTEQGARSRLLALEQELGIPLYHKRRGMRRSTPLTEAGRRFLPKAVAFLEHAQALRELFEAAAPAGEIRVAASQYLIAYVLIDAVRKFHAAQPHMQVRLSAHTEQEIEQALLASGEMDFGVAAPYESSPELEYRHLFSMDWSLITPRRHPLLRVKRLQLKHLVQQPLITYERGSTGRQHVLEAFHGRGLNPTVEVETTNTDLIVRMVEAGLGIAIVPLLPSGAVTRGRRVGIRVLGGQIRPIDSGILTRKGEPLNLACQQFIEFVARECGEK
jgi:DNA-binding transcriptional LysR family regulator